ncbi:MAG: DEAD/DEAH box helicase [Clostridia bacterium]|nr:DEAD/DEAH box helicase [Clostridia bacterium]
MRFADFNLPSYIMLGLEKQGIYEPTEIQELTIPLIREGRDVIGKSQTGSGKTYAFAIPLIENIDVDDRSTQVLIVCPTRELAGQVTDEIRKLTSMRESCKVVPIFGGSDMERQIKALKSGARIVVGTPGRIIDHLNRRTLKLKNVRTVVLDEADEMLNMGFKEDVENILKASNPYRQTVMFSATMPRAILEITSLYMTDSVLVETAETDKNASIDQYYLNVGLRDKTPALIDLIKDNNTSIAIVFCNTRKMVESLTTQLVEAGIDARGLHGEMRQSERRKVMASIKSGDTRVLVATDVAARGIDIHGVDVVYNYDIPQKTEYYTHRIGRTARAGRTGVAYTLINTKYQLDQLQAIHRDTDNVIGEYVCKYSVKREASLRATRGGGSHTRPNERGGDKHSSVRRDKSPHKPTRMDRYKQEGRYKSQPTYMQYDYEDRPSRRGARRDDVREDRKGSSYNGSDTFRRSTKRYGEYSPKTRAQSKGKSSSRDKIKTTSKPTNKKAKPTSYHIPTKSGGKRRK